MPQNHGDHLVLLQISPLIPEIAPHQSSSSIQDLWLRRILCSSLRVITRACSQTSLGVGGEQQAQI
jgi:hypothetical protein